VRRLPPELISRADDRRHQPPKGAETDKRQRLTDPAGVLQTKSAWSFAAFTGAAIGRTHLGAYTNIFYAGGVADLVPVGLAVVSCVPSRLTAADIGSNSDRAYR
jgi:hypothetical protein